MEGSSKIQVKVLTWLMEYLERRPFLATKILRPIANAPILSKKLMVLPRAFMGATAFEIHDVDMEKGRIGIGGVEEIMAGSKIIHLLHTVLAERMGEDEKNKALYEIGMNLCKWEVSQALENGMVLVTCLNKLKMDGVPIDEVSVKGAMLRMRPVLMTTLTTALGLIPLLLATGVGSEVQRPLATVVIGGLLTSTVLTLLVIPAIYKWFAIDITV